MQYENERTKEDLALYYQLGKDQVKKMVITSKEIGEFIAKDLGFRGRVAKS